MTNDDKQAGGHDPSPWRHLKPRLVPVRLAPFMQQYRNAKSGLGVFTQIKSQVAAGGPRCPRCYSAIQFTAADGPDVTPKLSCQSCGYAEELSLSTELAELQAQRLEHISSRTFYVALGFVVIASVIAATIGNVFTLIGGVLIALLMMMQSMAFEYRAWQFRNKRLYEGQSPFKEWIRQKLF